MIDAKIIEWIIAAPFLIGLLLISLWVTTESQKRLDDPKDDRTVYLDRLREILNLAPFGIYRVTILRQSGNIHADHIVTGSAQHALATALATFRRAKIDAVHVGANSETELRIGRLYHDHRGSNEGKKVGKAVITLVESSEPPHAAEPVPVPPRPAIEPEVPTPSISFPYVGITCDCGARYELSFDDLESERACESCGIDATLTPLQIAQIHRAADDARGEALERYRAGETDIKVEHKGKLTKIAAGLNTANIKQEAAQEAVARLGLLKPEAIETIVSLMDSGFAEHPRAIATRYRKGGEQLSGEDKKAAGIRASAFMSQRSYGELTDAGRTRPLTAHEATLLRAMFTEIRFNRLTSHGVSGSLMRHFEGFKYDTLAPDCPFCGRVNRTVVQADEVAILPPADCQCETANYSITPIFDWLRGVD